MTRLSKGVLTREATGRSPQTTAADAARVREAMVRQQKQIGFAPCACGDQNCFVIMVPWHIEGSALGAILTQLGISTTPESTACEVCGAEPGQDHDKAKHAAFAESQKAATAGNQATPESGKQEPLQTSATPRCPYCCGYPTAAEMVMHTEAECNCQTPCGAGGCPRGCQSITDYD